MPGSSGYALTPIFAVPACCRPVSLHSSSPWIEYMRSLALTLLLGASLVAPIAAQKMGGSNNNAPRVSQAIAYGQSKIALDYWSVNWGEGKFMGKLGNERMRDYINKKADESPIGKVSLDAPLKIAGKVVPAGGYALAFKVRSSGSWMLVLTPKKGDPIRWGLRLKDSDDVSKRLKIVLTAGEKMGSCDVAIKFGGKICKVSGTPVKADAEKKSDAKSASKPSKK